MLPDGDVQSEQDDLALLKDHFIQQSSVCWFLGTIPLKNDQSSGLKYVKHNKKNK